MVGHSLGAGAASVLAVLLRSQYKELHEPGRLHEYCFPTPPVLDIQAARNCKGFITAVVNRNDAVTRMSIANIEVVIKMLELLNTTVMKRAGLKDFWSISKESMFGKRIKQLTDEQLSEIVEIMLRAQSSVEIDHKEYLYIPGNCIAMYGTMDELPAKGENAIVTVKTAFVDPAGTFLRYFEMNDRMIDDHFIPAYRESLTACVDGRKLTEAGPKSDFGYHCGGCCLCLVYHFDKVCCFPCHLIKRVAHCLVQTATQQDSED